MRKIALFLFIVLNIEVYSQVHSSQKFPVSPEANSLIKLVDVPVNYSTGVTNYSIPIHNIKLKDLTIPISLTYQSSGFKPSEIASNVGLGWELNAGGKIIQNVVKHNDLDVPGPNNSIAWDLPNDRDFKLPLPVQDIHVLSTNYNSTRLDSIKSSGTDYFRINYIDQYNLDTQPDIFFYSTHVKSGKFFFGNNFEVKQIPFGKEKIIINNGYAEITDTDGVRYIYGLRTENLNTTINQSTKFAKLAGASNNNSYSYYLTQIITPNNETVDFSYDTVKYSLVNDKEYTKYSHWWFGEGEKVTTFISEITTKVLTKIKVNKDYEIDFYYNKFRKDINGTVQTNAPKTLDAINIKYKNTIETYNFDYGYFGIGENEYNPNLFESKSLNENSSYALKLKSFKKNGENPYFFSYYDEQRINRYSNCLDHWGYNSEDCGSFTFNANTGDFGSKKEPNLIKTRTNVLKSIILPTKGQIEFNYELNTCSNCILTYPVYNWIPYTVYSNDDDDFSGEWTTIEKEFTVPQDQVTSAYVKFNLYSPGPATTTNNAIAQVFDDQNQLIDINFSAKEGDNFRGLISALKPGKTYKLTLSRYDTMENENKYVSILFLSATYNFSEIQSVGGLRIKDIKTKDGSNFKSHRSFDYTDVGKSSGLLYDIPYYYDEYCYFEEAIKNDENLNDKGLQCFTVQYSKIPSDLFGYNGYHIFYKKVTENSNDINTASNAIKTEKYFTFYDDIRYGEQSYFSKVSYNWKRGLPSKVIEYRGNDSIKKIFFSYRFLDTPYSAGPMSSKHEPNFPLINATFPNEFHKRSIDIGVYRRNMNFFDLYYYKNSKLISAWYYMDKKITEEYFNGSVLKMEEEYKYENTSHAQLTSYLFKNSLGQELKTKYFYPGDLLGEPLMSDLVTANRIGLPIITEQYNAGGLISKTKKVFAKDATTNYLLVPNAEYSAKFPNNLPSILHIGNLEKKLTYNSYDFKGNLTQYTPESGAPVSIIWGYNNTLVVAKVEGVAYSSIPSNFITAIQTATDSATGTEAQVITALNALRSNLPNAMVTTFTHKPLIGVSTITDPKGLTTTYIYDAFNRLQQVKDHQGNILSQNQYNYRPQ